MNKGVLAVIGVEGRLPRLTTVTSQSKHWLIQVTLMCFSWLSASFLSLKLPYDSTVISFLSNSSLRSDAA